METCELLAEVIIDNSLLSVILTDMLTGSSEMYMLNNLTLSQLFCNQISKFMANIIDGKGDEDLGNDFIWLLSLAKKHLNWKDLSLIEHLKEVTVKFLSSPDKSMRVFSASLLDLNNGELLQAVDVAEQSFKLTEYDFDGYDSDQAIKLAETFSTLIDNNTMKNLEKMFLICYHRKVHALQCIVVIIFFYLAC